MPYLARQSIVVVVFLVFITACNSTRERNSSTGPTVAQTIPAYSTPGPGVIVLEGEGSGIFPLDEYTDTYAIRVWGDSDRLSIFVRNSLDETEAIFPAANNTYFGTHLLNDPGSQRIGAYSIEWEIMTQGPWRIEAIAPRHFPVLPVPGKVTGKGYDVFRLERETAGPFRISVLTPKDDFALNGYGEFRNRLAATNTIAEITATANEEVSILEIRSTGEWAISVE